MLLGEYLNCLINYDSIYYLSDLGLIHQHVSLHETNYRDGRGIRVQCCVFIFDIELGGIIIIRTQHYFTPFFSYLILNS